MKNKKRGNYGTRKKQIEQSITLEGNLIIRNKIINILFIKKKIKEYL